VVVIVPGYCTSVHVPDEGKPINSTLPVAKVQVGGVIKLAEGADGVGGCAFTITFSDGADIHPVELVTVKVYVPDGSAEIVVAVPVPEIVTPPGFMVNVQLPAAGNPLRNTLPADIAHVGWVMVPTTGTDGDVGGGLITISADGTEVHP
jgi:hypothetical protein